MVHRISQYAYKPRLWAFTARHNHKGPEIYYRGSYQHTKTNISSNISFAASAPFRSSCWQPCTLNYILVYSWGLLLNKTLYSNCGSCWDRFKSASALGLCALITKTDLIMNLEEDSMHALCYGKHKTSFSSKMSLDKHDVISQRFFSNQVPFVNVIFYSPPWIEGRRFMSECQISISNIFRLMLFNFFQRVTVKNFQSTWNAIYG